MAQWLCLKAWRLFHVWTSFFWVYDSVWPDTWPQNKCRSLWPIFHGPVTLCYILKTIWCVNIILGDYGSVWPDVWPQNKCISLLPIFHGPLIVGHCDLYFMVQWLCVISWRLFDVWTSSLGIMGQYDRTFDLKINVYHCYLYFMVHWFCLISQRLFDG